MRGLGGVRCGEHRKPLARDADDLLDGKTAITAIVARLNGLPLEERHHEIARSVVAYVVVEHGDVRTSTYPRSCPEVDLCDR